MTTVTRTFSASGITMSSSFLSRLCALCSFLVKLLFKFGHGLYQGGNSTPDLTVSLVGSSGGSLRDFHTDTIVSVGIRFRVMLTEYARLNGPHKINPPLRLCRLSPHNYGD